MKCIVEFAIDITVCVQGPVLTKRTTANPFLPYQIHQSEASALGSFPAVLDIEYKNRVTEFLSDNETAKALGGASPTIAAARANSSDGAERLTALKALLDKGVITQDDYEKKKAEILKTL